MEKQIRFYIDDGNKLDIRIANILTKYGFKGIFYVAPCYGRVNLINSVELRALAKDHEIGGHTLTHQLLTKLDKKQQKYEIIEGKNDLEDIIQKKITKFAYPRGWFNQEVKQSVEACGFKEARTMKMGVTSLKEYDQFEIPVSAQLYPRPEYSKSGIYRYIIRKFNEGDYFGLIMHGCEVNRFDYWDLLEKILKYINANKNNRT